MSMKEIPMSPTNLRQADITKAIENHIRQSLGEDVDLWLTRPFLFYTVAVRTITSAVQVLSDISKRFGRTEVCLYPTLTVLLSAKGEDEEKDGNLNVVFESDFSATVDDMKNYIVEMRNQGGQTYKTIKMRNPDDPNEERIIKRVNLEAVKDLQDKNSIMMYEDELPVIVTNYFLAGTFDILKQMVRDTGHSVMYNLGDVIELTATLRKGEPVLRILPGVCAKLTIKQDSFTEERK